MRTEIHILPEDLIELGGCPAFITNTGARDDVAVFLPLWTPGLTLDFYNDAAPHALSIVAPDGHTILLGNQAASSFIHTTTKSYARLVAFKPRTWLAAPFTGQWSTL